MVFAFDANPNGRADCWRWTVGGQTYPFPNFPHPLFMWVAVPSLIPQLIVRHGWTSTPTTPIPSPLPSCLPYRHHPPSLTPPRQDWAWGGACSPNLDWLVCYPVSDLDCLPAQPSFPTHLTPSCGQTGWVGNRQQFGFLVVIPPTQTGTWWDRQWWGGQV